VIPSSVPTPKHGDPTLIKASQVSCLLR
jgi:hypothetical protein